MRPPGAEGTFGRLAFSHEIIHHVGGQADTNRNTTQRILLLLEACPIRTEDGETNGPFDRVVRSILDRYLRNDTNLRRDDSPESRIPRFLLNDLVRYWRTMCVNFAYKEWEQGGQKWALRNLKLRMSRKLLFASGLLTVFSCYRNAALDAHAGDRIELMQAHLNALVRSTPLNIVSWSLTQWRMQEQAGKLCDEYDKFLGELDDYRIRERLGGLRPDLAYEDEQFLGLREISQRFQAILTDVFFDDGSALGNLTREYGVF